MTRLTKPRMTVVTILCVLSASSKVTASSISSSSPDSSLSTSDGPVSSASASTDQDESVNNYSTRNEDATSPKVSPGTKAGSKGKTTYLPSTANSGESSSRGQHITESTLTTEASGSTSSSSSTNSATSISDATTSSAASTEAGITIKSSPRNGETTSSSTNTRIAPTTAKGKTPSLPSTVNSRESSSRGQHSIEPMLTTEVSQSSSSTDYVTSTSDATSSSASITKAGTSIKSSPRNEETSSTVATSTGIAPSSAKACSDKLGMENRVIPDENIKASGYREKYPPWGARLNKRSLWVEEGEEVKPWIQADIGYQTYVSGVITQGDVRQQDDNPDWVTTLKVSTFNLNIADEEIFVSDNNKVKIFQANTDRKTAVTSTFPAPVFVRIIRITCLTKNDGANVWNLRFEVVGCYRNINGGDNA